MIYSALVLTLSDDIEEFVHLEINGQQLVCFAGLCPYPIEVGGIYQVELHPRVFDDMQVCEVSEDSPDEIRRLDEAFGYLLTGRLSGGQLSVGSLIFGGEDFLDNVERLEGRKVSVVVERMDAEFHE